MLACCVLVVVVVVVEQESLRLGVLRNLFSVFPCVLGVSVVMEMLAHVHVLVNVKFRRTAVIA